ncbi:hypothetical protein PHET_11458 [Paragonimus heterotremus]|uniref:Uncharacterized protein n=1 Tax=Paragonimus heterotremus TaxID=100268 RepID=A0A8J4SRP1_9TREM|nr:hypothetical protein PHET_11458 [Paragonimus heterotremus]
MVQLIRTLNFCLLVTTPLNRTYDLELPSVFVQTPKFTASSPCELAADFTPSPVKQASRWIEQGFDTPDWKPASGLRQELYSVETEVLKQSLEIHFSSSKDRPKDLLSAPRSMHRGPVKDKTPEGSAKRGRLLQALRTAHLERNEGVLDQLICNPRDSCQDLFKTARFDEFRPPPSAVTSGTPCLQYRHVPGLASLSSTTTTFHSQIATSLTEFSRLHKINPSSKTFATGYGESHSLKLTMGNAPNSVIPLHRGPLTRSAASPKVIPAFPTATQMPPPSYWDSALRRRTNNASRTPLCNPFSVSRN